jgi:LysM repeat protein
MTVFKRGLIFSLLFFFLFSTISAQEISTSEELDSMAPSAYVKYSENPLIDSLLTFAFKYLHRPYCGGAMGPNSFDCSGFTSFVYGHFGYKLERSSGAQTNNGVEISKHNLQPGDLVFFKGRSARASRIGHVGMVVSVNPDESFTFIHSACQTGVSHDNSTGSYYARRYVTARRVIGAENTIPSYDEKPIEPIEPVINPVEKTPDTIQTPQVETINIQVEKGQTLYSLSKKYGCTITQLKEWNDLTGSSLQIGQELKIETTNRDNSSDPIFVEESKEKNTPVITHIVKKGETLYQLAKDYNCTVEDISNWNNLESSNIHPNQELVIGSKHSSKSASRTKSHTVKAGETLSDIAEEHNCTVKQLKQKNGLRTSRINIGQRLKIPQD